MAADAFVAYGLVINAIQKPVYVNTNNQALQVLWYSQISAIMFLSVISNDQTILNVLSYWCHASPHPL